MNRSGGKSSWVLNNGQREMDECVSKEVTDWNCQRTDVNKTVTGSENILLYEALRVFFSEPVSWPHAWHDCCSFRPRFGAASPRRLLPALRALSLLLCLSLCLSVSLLSGFYLFLVYLHLSLFVFPAYPLLCRLIKPCHLTRLCFQPQYIFIHFLFLPL